MDRSVVPVDPGRQAGVAHLEGRVLIRSRAEAAATFLICAIHVTRHEQSTDRASQSSIRGHERHSEVGRSRRDQSVTEVVSMIVTVAD